MMTIFDFMMRKSESSNNRSKVRDQLGRGGADLAFEAVAAASRILPGAANVGLVKTLPTGRRRRRRRRGASWIGDGPREPSSRNCRCDQNPIHNQYVLLHLHRRGVDVRRSSHLQVLHRRERRVLEGVRRPRAEVPEERRLSEVVVLVVVAVAASSQGRQVVHRSTAV